MYTKFTVLVALFGITNMTQANNHFLAELHDTQSIYVDMQELDEFESMIEELIAEEAEVEEEVSQLSDKSQLVQMKELMGQMAKLIELQGKTIRRLSEDSVKADKAAVSATPTFKIPELRHAALDAQESRMDFQYKIMDLGATSNAIVGEIKSLGRLLSSMKSVKVQQLVFKRMVNIFQTAEKGQTAMKNSKQFKRLFTMKQEIIHLKNLSPQKIEDNLKKITASKIGLSKDLKEQTNLMTATNAKSQLKESCSSHPSKCAQLVENYVGSRKSTLSKAKKQLDLSYDKYVEAAQDEKDAAEGVKNFDGELKNFPKLLAAVDQYKEFIGPYGQFKQATDLVVKDIQAFFKKQTISDNCEIGSAEYKEICEYGQKVGQDDTTAMIHDMRLTLAHAKNQHGCTNLEVQNMVNAMSKKPLLNVPSICSTLPF